MKIDLLSYVPKREEISIPEWSKETIYVQELSGTQLEMLQRHAEMVKGKAVIRHQYVLLIIASLVDEKGEYIFSEKDIEALEKQPATLLARIVEVANRVSGVVASDL